MELFKASNQWATRPADERFWTVEEMAEQCLRYAEASVQSRVRYGDLRVEAQGSDMYLVGKNGTKAMLCNYAFGQVAQRVRAPASYLRKLPATLAAQNLNHGLSKVRGGDPAMLLLHRTNGSFLARCMTGVGYRRIWNYEIGRRLSGLQEYGWKVPPARPALSSPNLPTRIATEEDCIESELGMLSIKPGDVIAPAGVYASDRDMFVFMVNPSNVLSNPADPATPLARGFFVWNSEVGDKSFGVMTFLYDHVCGNHIVWGAKDVKEFRVRHVGSARSRAFSRIQIRLRQYADSSASEDEAKLLKAQSFELGKSKDEVLSALLSYASKRRLSALSEGLLEEAVEVAENNERYGNPRTPWAVAQGLTELSQRSSYASRRVDIDRDAGKLMEIAF